MKIGPYQIKLRFGSLIVVTLGLAFLLNLGFWQLDRAEEKRNILAEIESRKTAEPLTLQQLDGREDKGYYKVKLTGKFLSEPQFLLDNKIRNSQAGFEVIQAFKAQNRIILVNRGWIPLPRLRADLPEVPTPEGQQNIVGEVNLPSEAIVLREDVLPTDDISQLVIQAIDMTKLTEYFASKDYRIEPWIVRQEGDDRFFTRTWVNVSMPPERHTSYAVTWFGLAIALIIIYIAAASKREE